MRSSIQSAVAAVLLCGTVGCAAVQGPMRPRFYPNDTYRRYGASAADRAAADCASLADEYGENSQEWQSALTSTAGGAALGAGTGALAGVITQGKVGRATAAGAAIGGILGVLSHLNQRGESNPSRQRFVEACLKERGYDVIDWGR